MGGGVLPIDLLLEILHRLPVKSLLRFQSVSESWGCLMHDPDFIARHIRQVAESNSSTIITSDSSHDGNLSFSLIDRPPKLLTFSCGAKRDLEVIGSCNGLLCLVFQSRSVIISNLLINDHHVISMPASTPCKEFSEFAQVGFGYDSVKDDYKVVKIMLHRDDDSRLYISETSIYSLRCNGWSQTTKRLNAVGRRKVFPFLGRSYGVAVSGALHWLPYNKYKRLIIAVHLTTEESYEMSLPDQVSENDEMMMYITRMGLGVLNGCLCISSGACLDQPYHDVWVMKEYGIHASWTKLFRFMPSLGGSPFGVSALTPLIHFKKEDQVLLFQENYQKPYSFHLYDMSDKKQMECVSNYDKPIGWCEVKAICLATIVSLSDYKALWDEKDLSWKGRLRKRRRTEHSSSGGIVHIKDDVEKRAQALKAFEDDLEKNVQALKAFFYLRDQYIKGLSSNLRGEQKP